MASIVHAYNNFLEYGDHRVKDWFLMSSPFPTMAISLAFIFIVKFLGPKLMEDRKPFNLRKIIIVYNLFQVILSWRIFYEAATNAWLTNGDHAYNWRCQNIDRSPTGIPMKIAANCYLYYLSKFTEFFDTFFFVMRKRYDQVSTLHVIHHSIMPVSVWFGVKFYPGGHGTFFGLLNSGVHVVMYAYYMLAAMGIPKQLLWWKKYLTGMQMVQFSMVFVHSLQLFFYNPCGYPLVYCYVLIGHAIMFFFLFKAFYKKAYNTKKDDDAKPQSSLNGVCFPDINAQSAYAKTYKPQDVTFKDRQNRGFTQSE